MDRVLHVGTHDSKTFMIFEYPPSNPVGPDVPLTGQVPAYTGSNTLTLFLLAYSIIATGIILWMASAKRFNHLHDAKSETDYTEK